MPFLVIVDANVLFPFTLRDTMLRAATEGLYQLKWSQKILDETTENLVLKGIMSEEQANRLRGQMERFFPEAMVSGYEEIVPAMQNDPKDRHVTAAAVKCAAQVIVTSNLKDFKSLPDGIEAQSPDEFLCNLFDLDPDVLVSILRSQAADLRRPPHTFEEILTALGKMVPQFIADVRKHIESNE